MRRSYAGAWNAGHATRSIWGHFGIVFRPFWRGKKHLTAWDNGYERAKTQWILYCLRTGFKRDRAC